MPADYCSCCGADLRVDFVQRGDMRVCAECGTGKGSENWDRPAPLLGLVSGFLLLPPMVILFMGTYEPPPDKKPVIRAEWPIRVVLAAGFIGLILYSLLFDNWVIRGLAAILVVYLCSIPLLILVFHRFNPWVQPREAASEDSQPDRAEEYLSRAAAKSRAYDVQGAVRDYQNAARLFGDQGQERRARQAAESAEKELKTRQLRLEGRVRRLTDLIEKAHQSDQSWPGQYEHRGLLLATLGRHAEALSDLQIAERDLRSKGFTQRADETARRIDEVRNAIALTRST